MLNTNEDIKQFALKLAKTEDEEDVIEVLKEYKLWDRDNWQYFGDMENNYSVIGNQQSNSIAALIEKITNSGDAILTRMCLERGIDPTSNLAPSSINDALEKFLDIKDGDICNLSSRKRSKLAEDNILLVTTSRTGKIRDEEPCFSIIDKGEGQTPDNITETFLSLNKENKLSIPFVQGQFNMGGTGVLQFCGKNKFHLILTKRHNNIDDSSRFKDYWGVTLIRMADALPGQKSTSYMYLAPNENILKFKADYLNLIPEGTQNPVPYKLPMECGTFIKLYNYDAKPYNNRNVTISGGLTDGLNQMLAKPAIPVRLVECRNARGRTLRITVSGFEPRLSAKGKVEKNIEEGFPIVETFYINNEKIEAKIYAFTKGSEKNYKKASKSICFVLNGQTQGSLSQRFFTRKNVKLDYIKESIFVIVNCSNISIKNRQNLFMNSRDRLRESEFTALLKGKLEEILGENTALNDLKMKRKSEDLQSKTVDNKVLAENLDSLIKKNPSLSKIFNLGDSLKSKGPSKPEKKKKQKPRNREEFVGKHFATYFKPKNNNLKVPLGKKVKITLETDAENFYFNRDKESGTIKLFRKRQGSDKKLNEKNYGYNLDSGILEIKIDLPEDAEEKDAFEYIYEIENRQNQFSTNGVIKVEVGKKVSKKKKRKKKGDNDSSLSLPDIILLSEEEAKNEGMQEKDVMIVRGNTEDGYVLKMNEANKYFNEINHSQQSTVKKEAEKNKFIYSMALVAISAINNYKEIPESVKETNNIDLDDIVGQTTKNLAPVLFSVFSIHEVLSA